MGAKEPVGWASLPMLTSEKTIFKPYIMTDVYPVYSFHVTVLLDTVA